MILVTGASGNYGLLVIQNLLKKGVKGNTIAGLVRDQSKAEPLEQLGVQARIGDYDDMDTLVRAFNGIEKLMLVSGNNLADRSLQHRRVVTAAKLAGIKHIVYTSVERRTNNPHSPLNFVLLSHRDTEDAIKESDITYTILQNNLYLNFLPYFLGENFLDTGIYIPAGDGRIAFALREEMAEVAANVLITRGHDNKEYEISGSKAVSFKEIAGMLSEIKGRKLTYRSPSYNEFVAALRIYGIPRQYAEIYAGFAEAARQNELSSGSLEMEDLLGRKPTSVKEYLSSLYGGR